MFVHDTSFKITELDKEELKAHVLNDSTQLRNFALAGITIDGENFPPPDATPDEEQHDRSLDATVEHIDTPRSPSEPSINENPDTTPDRTKTDPNPLGTPVFDAATVHKLIESAAATAAQSATERLTSQFEQFHPTTGPPSKVSTNKAPGNSTTELHIHSLERPGVHQNALSYLRRRQTTSSKSLPYFHDEKGHTMLHHAYMESRMPKIKVKHFVHTVGMLHQLKLHAEQYGIYITHIADIAVWDPHQARNPTTCPYTNDITYECDHVYTTAANKIFNKISLICDFQHDALQQVFESAGQYAAQHQPIRRTLRSR